MNLLKNIKSRPLPLARLMGITFKHAERDKVIARMVVRPDLCTLGHKIHGGSAMAFCRHDGRCGDTL
jgi:1,4-dihydroxy-2-naphthoyl-CoA hydrolase